MSYLRNLDLFTHSPMHTALCFALFVFVLSLAYPMLLVYLDCPSCVAPSAFFEVYFNNNSFISRWYALLLQKTRVTVVRFVLLAF